MQILGSLLLVSAGILAAGQRIADLYSRQQTLMVFSSALRRGAAELETNLTPTGELMDLLSEQNDRRVSAFFSHIHAGMEQQGPQTFYTLWKEAVAECDALKPVERAMLSSLGAMIGQYCSADICSEMVRCADCFQLEGENLRRQFPEQTRLSLGIGVTVGAIAAILLI